MNSIDIDNICRVCLQNDTFLISIFKLYNNYFLAEVLLELTGFNIKDDNDGLPKNCCDFCAKKLINAYEIRRLFINSDQYLRHQLAIITQQNDEQQKKIVCAWEQNNSVEPNFPSNDDNFSYISNFITKDEDDHENEDNDAHKDDIEPNDVLEEEHDINNYSKKKTAIKGRTKLQKKENDNENLLEEDDNKTDETDILCEICKKVFPNRTSFRRHKNYHKIEKTKCPLCPKYFAHKSNLKRHLLVHKDKKPFVCDKCCKSFTQSNFLYEHLKVHNTANNDKDEYTMKCNLCNEETTSYAFFTTHMKEKHNIDKVKPFQCHICSMQFASKQGMYRHIDNIHENNRRNLRNRDKNFLCNTCGKSFYTNFHLEVHIRSHTGEKPFQCEFCEKSFSQLSGLRMHTYTHTGERPFSCKKCDKTFNQYGHVREHMLTHTDLRPHVCTVCNHGFRVKGNLTAHMLIHTGKRKYLCEICNKRFIQSTKLEQHMKRIHSSE